MNPQRTRIAAVTAILVATSLLLPGLASARDRNDDRIPDRWERRHGLSLEVNQARRDQDRDGLRNRGEFRARMDPRDPDSDGDGVRDSREGAGVVAAHDRETGRLRIELFGGDAVAGWVTPETEVVCDDGDDRGDEDGDGRGGGDAGEPDGGEPEGDGPGDEPGDEVRARLGEDPGEPGDESGAGDGEEPGEGDGEEPGEGDGPADGEESGEGDGPADGEEPGEGDGEEPGEGEEPGDDSEEELGCSAADLAPGVIVQEARLRLTGDGLVFDRIEILLRSLR